MPDKGSAFMLHPVTDETLRKLPIRGFLGGAHTCGRPILQLGMVLPKAGVHHPGMMSLGDAGTVGR